MTNFWYDKLIKRSQQKNFQTKFCPKVCHAKLLVINVQSSVIRGIGYFDDMWQYKEFGIGRFQVQTLH